jgi:hypothetical protein
MEDKLIMEEIKHIKLISNLLVVGCFVLWVMLTVVTSSYNMSYDKHYVDNVNARAFESKGGIEDIYRSGIVAQYDAMGAYEDKVWNLKNPELYFIGYGILYAILFGCLSFFIIHTRNELIDDVESRNEVWC